MKKSNHRYVVCVKAEDAEDLVVRKLYRVLGDEDTEGRGYLRAVDESGEDYVYPAEWFITVEVPEEAEQALASSPSR